MVSRNRMHQRRIPGELFRLEGFERILQYYTFKAGLKAYRILQMHASTIYPVQLDFLLLAPRLFTAVLATIRHKKLHQSLLHTRIVSDWVHQTSALAGSRIARPGVDIFIIQNTLIEPTIINEKHYEGLISVNPISDHLYQDHTR